MEKITESCLKRLDEICEAHKDEEGPVKLMLHDIQNEFGYIPFEGMESVSKYSGRSVADVYGVVTFYTQFTTVPKGKHVINVCLGTACYVNGAQAILEQVLEYTKATVNGTSEDGLFSVDATRCLGACGLAPVLVVDGHVYGNSNKNNVVDNVISKLVDSERGNSNR